MPNQCCEHCTLWTEDHDLLIQINTKLATLVELNGKHYDDHEDRMRRLERWGFLACGALFVVQFMIGYYISLIK